MCNTTTAPARRCEQGQGQRQTDENPRQNHRNGGRFWGDRIRSKKSNAVRIVFGNVNSLGQSKSSSKMVQLEHCIRKFDIDFMCMAETGVHWKFLPAEDRLWERVKNWASNRRIAFSYNSNDTLAQRCQYGGTAILGVNDIAPKIQSRGVDNSGLGRWCWFRIQGKNNVYTRIVTAYCPCKPPTTHHGLQTVYAQHLRALSKDPIATFWNDLKADIHQWHSIGDNLIICGDWNQSILNAEIIAFMNTYNLEEAITHVHGRNPPATYQRGTSSIDGIFVSRTFLGVRGGYLEYGATPGDHRGIWIDVPQETLLGHKMPIIPPKQMRHLKCSDTKGKHKYKTSLHDHYLHNNVYGQILHLRNNATIEPSSQIQYNKLDAYMTTLKKSSARKCRKR
jgi:exonuclease III